MHIRPYTDEDHGAFRQVLRHAQDEDGARDPWLASADAMMGDYLTGLFQDLELHQGAIFVAEDTEQGTPAAKRALGFVAVLGACRDHDIDETDHVFGFITDLVVDPAADRDSVADALLARAQRHVADCGTKVIRASIQAKATALRAVYAAQGFDDRLVQIEKSLDDVR